MLDQTVSDEDAIRELLRRAAVAHGIGTARDFADYYRIKGPRVGVALQELEDAGELIPVEVPGWESGGRPVRGLDAPGCAQAAARSRPRPCCRRSTRWSGIRDRALRMFGFHYRIEIYTPAPKRVYGYYSLPILIDDALVGRIDLKSDRQAGVLRVQSAWTEPGAPPATLDRLLPLLRRDRGLAGARVGDGRRGRPRRPRAASSPTRCARG